MAKFEILPTIPFHQAPYMKPDQPPEVVHLEDPAMTVMIDFKYAPTSRINPNASIDFALNAMKNDSIHAMLVTDPNENVIGLISSEDILGEKPIKLLEERRIEREEILVKMIMLPEFDIIAFDIESLRLARVEM